MAFIVLGLNIWTTNDNALYSGGLGLANITGFSKKAMVLISGAVGTVGAVWLYNNFCGWLSMLNATLPPVGIILILSYMCNSQSYENNRITTEVNWFAVAGVIIGAVAANYITWGISAINGMVVAAVCYLAGQMIGIR